MSNKQSYLRDCPTCNSNVYIIVTSKYSCVRCSKCGKTTEHCKNFYQACAQWNGKIINDKEDNTDEPGE